MKAMILAGGFGTRLSEETSDRPKPMVEIGGRPILWHIMKSYSAHGINDFVICLGYKSGSIKKFFIDYAATMADFTISLADNHLNIHQKRAEDWKVTLVDTGLNTMTGGRIRRAAHYIDEEDFCLTYGDGVGDVDIAASVSFHKAHGKLATVTAVTPPGRFGVLDMDGDVIHGFREKISSDQYRINAGFFVLKKGAVDYVAGDDTVWEQEPMVNLARDGELRAWHHDGFWQPMDTLRDKTKLEEMWQAGTAKWRKW